MKIFENHDTVSALYQRALRLAISKDFADVEHGKIQNEEQHGSEQANRRRELLAVERQAQKNKIIEAHGQSHFKAQVTERLFERVENQVDALLEDKHHLFNNVINIDKISLDMIDILAVKAASIKRITPLANALPWLADEIVKLVNKPQYRKRGDVQVTEPSLALSYIGLDNLKRIIPIFIIKHCLPVSTSPFPLMKRKLWSDCLAIAMATKVLAKQHNIDEFTAYIAGLFSSLGYFAVTRSVISTFNDFHLEEVKAAYDDKDKKLHDTLVKIAPPPHILHHYLVEQSATITAELVELMPLDRIRITEAMFDLANITTLDKMCPIAQLIMKAKAYITFRSLAKEELINRDEAKVLYNTAKLTAPEIKLLKASDIDHIKLDFN